MKTSHSLILATKLLGKLVSGPHGDALAGDLIEQYRQGRSAVWFWRQALLAIIVSFMKDRTLGGPAVLGSLLVFLLMIVSVGRHPSSLGGGLFTIDLALLSGYGAFSIWVWRERRPEQREALAAGAQSGVILGVILIASHAIEWFALRETRAAQLVRGAGSMLLMLGLLGAAGSAAWQRTRSAKLAVIAGLWCGSLGVVILLNFALTLNLAFEAHAELWLHEPIAASGTGDAGAFLVRNSLEAASEILVRIPFAALVMAFIGGVSNAWMMKWPRRLAVLAAWFTPFFFAAGAAALWYADSLDRAARPPFVMAGVLTAGIALCGAHPIWSSLSSRRGPTA
ncbi:MAG TPA: hypothetical protein VI488_09375 [Candidatus Angelobacter sp.]